MVSYHIIAIVITIITYRRKSMGNNNKDCASICNGDKMRHVFNFDNQIFKNYIPIFLNLKKKRLGK